MVMSHLLVVSLDGHCATLGDDPEGITICPEEEDSVGWRGGTLNRFVHLSSATNIFFDFVVVLDWRWYMVFQIVIYSFEKILGY